jgi:hypothetical protein
MILEAISTSERFVYFYKATRRLIPEGSPPREPEINLTYERLPSLRDDLHELPFLLHSSRFIEAPVVSILVSFEVTLTKRRQAYGASSCLAGVVPL